jgi:hypothetical protein
MTMIDVKTVWATESPSSHDKDGSNKRTQAPRSRFGLDVLPPSGIDVSAPRSATARGLLYRITIKYVIYEQIGHLTKTLLLLL